VLTLTPGLLAIVPTSPHPGHFQSVGLNLEYVHDRDRTPGLLDSFVAYVDLLGTKERVATLTDAQLLADIDHIKELRPILHDETIPLRSHHFVAFTDNLVLGTTIDAFSAARQLRFLVTAIAHYQLGYATRGRLVRGGIARGPFFGNPDLVTGQALVDAVLIESTRSIYPRVVLDSRAYTSIKASGIADNRTAGMGMQWEDALLVDGDGQLFVNYLLANDRITIPSEIERRLELHRDIVLAGLTTHTTLSLADKYVWMADYHNFVQRDFFVGYPIRIDDIPRSNHAQRTFRRLTDVPLDHAVTEILAADESDH
jgi:hypothetical protein